MTPQDKSTQKCTAETESWRETRNAMTALRQKRRRVQHVMKLKPFLLPGRRKQADFNHKRVKLVLQSIVVLVLLLENAKQICKNIKNSYKIESVHPSPLSCKKFFGSRPFTKCNDQLIKFGKLPIYWGLD